ncbi:hypothetical protein L6164_020731 [Bauhinia variegata]|uniref:Uncharacterized protein n=1 Tax=Bauhinia variegata TaxID=167791 RepID=A0ACB9MY23_BAUVA|nr:hypothetical protein L6164_020731 [Bauhinia variegata]
MLSLNASSVYFVFSQYSSAELNPQLFPSIFFIVGSRRRRRRQQFASLNLVAVKETDLLFGYWDSLKKGNSYQSLYSGSSGSLRRCKDLDGEGDFSLEAEILEFMKNSKKPEAFPTKRELVAAGRMDLVDAIIKKGGWLSLGWDLDEEAEEGLGQMSVKSKENEIQGPAAAVSSSSSADCSQPAKSSDRSIELKVEESGIEGILNRLEKERNNSLGLGFRDDKNEWQYRTTADATVADPEKSSIPAFLSPRTSPLSGFQRKIGQDRSLSGIDGSRNSLKPETWRSWIAQRAGDSDIDFEDAEIAPTETGKEGATGVSGKDVFEVRNFTGEKELDLSNGKVNHSEINSRILELDSELFSLLRSLRSRDDEVAINMDQEGSPDDLQNCSDTWEFQENEIMKANDRLRSIRAKLAVLEGKMALAIIDAQKIVEEKQKKIEHSHRAIQLIRDTRIIWPNTASEVLLAGSFDGWSSQRRMEKSDTGIFSLSLKLYPGSYEIKFIVDGEWRIDPLRPIVQNNGYVNNLLVVH